ncbi:MAG: ComEC/Rec2 family competence protein [bacterium]|nr:ComEC/Rec2 family competence protein [bacterium]
MDREILIVIFSFVFGILVSSFVFISPLVSLCILIIGLAIIVSDRKIEVLFISLALISFSLGCLRYSIKDFHETIVPGETGVVVSEPEQRENATRFVLHSNNNEKVLVSTGLYSPVQYGDRVNVEGKLKEPGIIEDEDGGRPFDYAKYLSKDDIYYTMSFAKIEVLGSGEGSVVKAILLKIKRSFVNKIREILAEPYSSLLAGLLVAGRDAMPAGLLEEFRRAGIIHIVVLSGFNITIIADFMRKLFRNNAVALLGILMFVIMTGAEATVVRASLMVTAVVAAKMTRRKFSAPRALLLAGFLMLLENPKILVFDPSFQLSFLATLALIYVVPIAEKYLEKLPERWEFRSIVATTIGTQITVLPLLIYSMGDFSLVSLPANILVLLIIPFTMLIGFLATLLGYVSLIIAWPLSYLSHLLLGWILLVAHVLGNLSFASVAVPPVHWSIIALAYLALIVIVWRWQNSLRKISS